MSLKYSQQTKHDSYIFKIYNVKLEVFYNEWVFNNNEVVSRKNMLWFEIP